MRISFLGTLTHTITGVGRETFPSKGPMRGQYVFCMANSQKIICFKISISISGDSEYYFIVMNMLISLECYNQSFVLLFVFKAQNHTLILAFS